MSKILDDAGTVDAVPGAVLIDGKGHPVASYTPDAASKLAARLTRAAEEAARPSPAYTEAGAAETARNPSPE